ncbi:MAG: shikimate kinase [Acidimicrobiales bacterium]
MPERLLLVGMMGSGKSSVGRLVADRLGWGFTDTDEEVEKAAGMSIPELFASDGEAAFRADESVALAACVAADGDTVVSVGGGAVLGPVNRERMKGAGPVVWLRARPETLMARLGDGSGRPLLSTSGDLRSLVSEMDAARRPLYDALADLVVDVDDLSPEAVADRVVAALPSQGGEGQGPNPTEAPSP